MGSLGAFPENPSILRQNQPYSQQSEFMQLEGEIVESLNNRFHQEIKFTHCVQGTSHLEGEGCFSGVWEMGSVPHASLVFFFFFLTSDKQLQWNIVLPNYEVIAKLWSQSPFLQIWGKLLRFGVKEMYSWHSKFQLGKTLMETFSHFSIMKGIRGLIP